MPHLVLTEEEKEPIVEAFEKDFVPIYEANLRAGASETAAKTLASE